MLDWYEEGNYGMSSLVELCYCSPPARKPGTKLAEKLSLGRANFKEFRRWLI